MAIEGRDRRAGFKPVPYNTVIMYKVFEIAGGRISGVIFSSIFSVSSVPPW